MIKKIIPLIILIFAICLSIVAQDQIRNPGARYGHDMAFDEKRGNVVLFGGFHNRGEPLGDTWIFEKRKWKLVCENGPTPRKWAAMAYDAGLEKVILFGGRTGIGQSGKSLSDTWIWNGQKWKQQKVNAPPARDHHRMVFDSKRKRIFLFGGWDGKKLLGDTWEFDGKKWKLVSEKGPSPRAPTALAFDDKNKEVVLFGGKTLKDFFDDTWVWNGKNWTERKVKAPSARAFHAMSYDPENSQVILFSGRFENEMLNDTWAWNGKSWKKLDDKGPVKRGIYSLVYDKANKHFLFYGSGKREDDKWILDDEMWFWKGSKWHLLPNN